jgi:AcrR family transcriptional regulator
MPIPAGHPLMRREARDGLAAARPEHGSSAGGDSGAWRSGDFAGFKRDFPYRGRVLYEVLFDRHGEQIRTKKAKFAVSNLEKIFSATFKLSNQIGFQAMSLRQLSAETGISMGGLYSCLASKEDIAIMVKELVQLVSDELIQASSAIADPGEALDATLRHHVFATHLLQPWFSFLYFETRSLPRPQQEASKRIELRVAQHLATLVENGQRQGRFRDDVPAFALDALGSLIQEGYLKPWKFRLRGIDVDAYADEVVAVAHRLTT